MDRATLIIMSVEILPTAAALLQDCTKIAFEKACSRWSLKIIGIAAIWYATDNFLLVVCSNTSLSCTVMLPLLQRTSQNRATRFWLDLGHRLSGTADFSCCRWRCRQSRCDDCRAVEYSGVSAFRRRCDRQRSAVSRAAVCSAFSQLRRRLERLRSADRRLSKCAAASAVHRAVWWQSRSVTQPTLLSHSMYTRRRRLAAAQLTTLTAIARCRIQLPFTPSACVLWTYVMGL